MLRLIGEFEFTTCPTCNGKGKVPCPPTFAVRSGCDGGDMLGPINQPGTGHPIPCPTCKGKKVIECHPPQHQQPHPHQPLPPAA